MADTTGTSTATSRWEGDMRAAVTVGESELMVDELGSAEGSGPQPTDLLLAAVASCFTLAMVFVARKRDLELPGLDVTAVGTYDGPRFTEIAIYVRSDAPRDVLDRLIPSAERVCWVTNTLRTQPAVSIRSEA
jgi:putative redox protein